MFAVSDFPHRYPITYTDADNKHKYLFVLVMLIIFRLFPTEHILTE